MSVDVHTSTSENRMGIVTTSRRPAEIEIWITCETEQSKCEMRVDARDKQSSYAIDLGEIGRVFR